ELGDGGWVELGGRRAEAPLGASHLRIGLTPERAGCSVRSEPRNQVSGQRGHPIMQPWYSSRTLDSRGAPLPGPKPPGSLCRANLGTRQSATPREFFWPPPSAM